MVSINYALREISCKIVYYGPGLSGKTTNLQFVHGRVPANARGELISLATEADRTLYFDFLPIDVGQIAGFATKFQLYTVPGQVFYEATRRLVLRGVDGLVFVADSQADKMDENIESLTNMYDNLKEYGIDVDSAPLVFQWNKRDLPGILPIETLEEKLNPRGLPSFEAVASAGQGVFETLKKITKIVLEGARTRATASASATNVAAKSSPAPAPDTPVGQPELAGVGAPVVSTVRGSSSSTGTAGQQSPSRAATETRGTKGPAIAAPSTVIEQAPSSPVDKPTMAPSIHRAQKSRRIRHKKKSFLARIFEKLFGR